MTIRLFPFASKNEAHSDGLISAASDTTSLQPILLVEDNPNDLELVLAALSKCQLANEIVIARDGVEALDYLKCRNQWAGRAPRLPAVVLLDLKMPRIDGLEALQQIRTDPALEKVPVVILTSSLQESDMLKTCQIGISAFVVKPINAGDFVISVQKLGLFWGSSNSDRTEHPRA